MTGFSSFDVIMMSRSFLILSLVCSVVLLVAASAAFAQPTDGSPLALQSDFDLARHGQDRDGDKRFRIRNMDGARGFRTGPSGPQWSYSPVDGGPTVELAALGAGRKGAPKLAHVGVDWNF